MREEDLVKKKKKFSLEDLQNNNKNKEMEIKNKSNVLKWSWANCHPLGYEL